MSSFVCLCVCVEDQTLFLVPNVSRPHTISLSLSISVCLLKQYYRGIRNNRRPLFLSLSLSLSPSVLWFDLFILKQYYLWISNNWTPLSLSLSLHLISDLVYLFWNNIIYEYVTTGVRPGTLRWRDFCIIWAPIGLNMDSFCSGSWQQDTQMKAVFSFGQDQLIYWSIDVGICGSYHTLITPNPVPSHLEKQ